MLMLINGYSFNNTINANLGARPLYLQEKLHFFHAYPIKMHEASVDCCDQGCEMVQVTHSTTTI